MTGTGPLCGKRIQTGPSNLNPITELLRRLHTNVTQNFSAPGDVTAEAPDEMNARADARSPLARVMHTTRGCGGALLLFSPLCDDVISPDATTLELDPRLPSCTFTSRTSIYGKKYVSGIVAEYRSEAQASLGETPGDLDGYWGVCMGERQVLPCSRPGALEELRAHPNGFTVPALVVCLRKIEYGVGESDAGSCVA